MRKEMLLRHFISVQSEGNMGRIYLITNQH